MTVTERLPVVVVGAGAMGREWLRMLAVSPHAEPVGVIDLDLDLARSSVASLGLGDLIVGPDVAEVAARSGARAVVNVTVPQAHRIVNEQALRAGLPVLCEKPIAATLPQALAQVALADLTGELLMVSQSRRYFRHLAAFRDNVGRLGPLGIVTARFLHADHEPGFREQMAHPLLIDMSIHHFDQLRSLTDDVPVAVRCSSWNPPWSWFAGDAAATAEFELASGARFQYAGSRATPGLQTSWNGEWTVHGEGGAARWDGDDHLLLDAGFEPAPVTHGPEQIEASLAEFVASLRSGETPQNEVRDNILSLAMVEGAIRSSELGGRRVDLAELLEAALAEAVGHERGTDVGDALAAWSSAADAITRRHWGGRDAAGSPAHTTSAGGAR